MKIVQMLRKLRYDKNLKKLYPTVQLHELSSKKLPKCKKTPVKKSPKGAILIYSVTLGGAEKLSRFNIQRVSAKKNSRPMRKKEGGTF